MTTSERRNFYHLVLDITWFGVALVTTTRFLSVYAIRLNASPITLGWLTALPAIVLLISSSFGGWWRRKFKDTGQAIFLPALGFRFAYFLLALTPFLPERWQPIWLILAVTLPAIPQGIGGVIFVVLMREAVDSSRITQLVSSRALMMNIALALSALLCGIWLENAPFPLNYQIMFLFAFLATLISLIHVKRVKPIVNTGVPQQPIHWRTLFQSAGMRKVAWITTLTHVTFFSVFPLVPLYLVDDLSATEGFIALFGLVELAGGALVATMTGRIAAKIGVQSMVGYGMMFTAIAVWGIVLAPTLHATLIAAGLLGAAWSAVTIGLFGVMTETAPAGESTAYATLYTQTIGLATFIGPMIGSVLAEADVNLGWVLLGGGVLRLIAGVVILPRLHAKQQMVVSSATR
ncbi:MAG: MFS transporter [Phototrophicales bacterium]